MFSTVSFSPFPCEMHPGRFGTRAVYHPLLSSRFNKYLELHGLYLLFWYRITRFSLPEFALRDDDIHSPVNGRGSERDGKRRCGREGRFDRQGGRKGMTGEHARKF